jgi:hypothetical protein
MGGTCPCRHLPRRAEQLSCGSNNEASPLTGFALATRRVAGRALAVTSVVGTHRQGRPRRPYGTAPAIDQNAGRISSDGLAAHHDVGIAALLEVRIEDRVAGRAPARLPSVAS